MPFTYARTIHFKDTDAAGVVYFANVLSMCHEAYEASLAAAGLNLNAYFCYPKIAIPITHSTIDFLRPMFCGDQIKIHLTPKELSDSEFEIQYEVFAVETSGQDIQSISEVCTARAFTKHVCIDAVHRVRTALPNNVSLWLNQWSQPSPAVSGESSFLL